MTLVDALLAIAASDRDAAIVAAEAAATDGPPSRLAPALLDFLREVGPSGVYDEPTAFERFIDGGGHPLLYERTIAELARVHADEVPTSVLDVGCGDGRVTAAVGDPAAAGELVEPSTELLHSATRTLRARGHRVDPHEMGIDAFLSEHPRRRWDVVQSTFAMSALDPMTRRDVFGELARRTNRLVIVDFDVPDVVDRSVAHARYVVDRYERGLAEYVDAPDVVSGFLLPVLVGQFDPARTRHTFEQSTWSWVAQLEAAGFAVDVRAVADYWWAPAKLFDARITPPGPGAATAPS